MKDLTMKKLAKSIKELKSVYATGHFVKNHEAKELSLAVQKDSTDIKELVSLITKAGLKLVYSNNMQFDNLDIVFNKGCTCENKSTSGLGLAQTNAIHALKHANMIFSFKRFDVSVTLTKDDVHTYAKKLSSIVEPGVIVEIAPVSSLDDITVYN